MTHPTPDPLAALEHLEAWLTKCSGHCPAEVWQSIDRIRHGLRDRLAEPDDPLDDAADALQRAQAKLHVYHGKYGEAIQHALTQAAVSLGHARTLAGKG